MDEGSVESMASETSSSSQGEELAALLSSIQSGLEAEPTGGAVLNPAASLPGNDPAALASRPLVLPESDDVSRLSATTLEGLKTLTLDQGVLIHLEADGLLDETQYFPVEDPDRLVIDLSLIHI